jgi:hypothetical protein
LGQPGFFTVVTIGDKNKVTATAPTKVTLKSSGEWSGVFAHPSTGKKVSARGVILRHLGYGTGFFLDAGESGHSMLQPQP